MEKYAIITLAKKWPLSGEFVLMVKKYIENIYITDMAHKFKAYDFDNHIFSLREYLDMFYIYYSKNVMNIDNDSYLEMQR